MLFAAFLAFLVIPVSGQDIERGVWDIEFRKILDNVYVAYRPGPVRIPVEGNVTIILTDRDVVVVDSGGAPVAARQTIAKIRELTDKPVRVLVNTHGHGDHTLGNQEYAAAFPGLQIISHPGTRNYMLSIGMRGLKYVGEIASPEGVEERKRQGIRARERARQKNGPGLETVLDYLDQYYERDLFVRSQEYKTVDITPPTATITEGLTLHRGEQEIRILHMGYGNTASDLVVYLPREKLVITGDIVTLPVPYGFSRGPVQWMATLDRLVEFDFDVLIPGHGEVQRDKAYVNSMRALFRSVVRQVRQGVDQGLSLEKIREQVDLSSFRAQFGGSNLLYRNRFDEWFADPVVGRIFDELTAETPN